MNGRMSNMKKNMIIEFPENMMKKIGDVSFLPNGDDGLFYQSKMTGKLIKKMEGYIIQNKKAHGMSAVIYPDYFRATVQMTLPELRKLVKLAEKKHLYFEKIRKNSYNKKRIGCFYIHFSPDFSIAIK